VVSVFRHSVGTALAVQLAVELACLLGVALVAFRLDSGLGSLEKLALPALVFALLILLLNVSFGLYRRPEKLTSTSYIARVLLAPAIGVPLASVILEFLPAAQPLQQNLVVLIVLSFAGLLFVRHALVLPLVAAFVPHRVLVLGTGTDARTVETSLAQAGMPNMKLVGFCALDKVAEMAIAPSRVVGRGMPLEDVVRQLGIHEIIVAVRQQRGGVLPLRELLDCRLRGVQITDLSRFFERVHGFVPIESLKVSWLIYGEGYRQTLVRNFIKRTFDVTVTLLLLLLTAPVMLFAAALIAIESGAPVIYRQERVGLAGRTFTLLKFRSMSRDAEKDGKAAWASVNDSRVTRVGRLLRRTRIDELPQLINVLKGEMSFVGPRPERPEFVEMLTEQIPFYAARSSVKPGLTGWAQVRYSYGATVEQSVKKLEYDLYYVKNHSLLLDLVILLETVRVVLLGEGAR
jgi:sugar transferase (PEP-CTERM system associated)